MDFTQITLVVLPILLSTGLSYVIMQAVLSERLKNVKENFDKHETSSRDDISGMKKELLDAINTQSANYAKDINGLSEYIKRVEANKADRSEVNLIVDTMRRVEQKLDLLIMQRNP
jgi:hypothetical protein